MGSVQEVGGQLRLGLHIQELVEQNIKTRKQVLETTGGVISTEAEKAIAEEEWCKLENAVNQLAEAYKPKSFRKSDSDTSFSSERVVVLNTSGEVSSRSLDNRINEVLKSLEKHKHQPKEVVRIQ